MKATEYYDKYAGKFFGFPCPTIDEAQKAEREVIADFMDEVSKLIEVRHVKFNAGVTSIVVEQNQKWNALCGIFTRKHGFSPLYEDGFKKFWDEYVTELKEKAKAGRAAMHECNKG